MSHSHRLKTKARREARTDACGAAFGAQCTENIPDRSNETADQNAKAIEMFIDDHADDDSDVGTTAPSMQHHGEFEKKPGIHTRQPLRRTRQADGRRESLGGREFFIEDNTDTIVSTMEWRRKVLESLEESRDRQNGEGRRRAKLDAEIKRIQQHYREQEKVLEREFAKLERKYESTIAELEREGKDEEYYLVDGCDAQSDYQPTECGEGSGSVMPEHKQRQPQRAGEVELRFNVRG